MAFDPVRGYLLTANPERVHSVSGTDKGQRTLIRQTFDHFSTSLDFWIPACGPDSHLTTGTLPDTEPYCYQFGPSLAIAVRDAGTVSRFSSHWHDTRDNADNLHVDIWGSQAQIGRPIDLGNQARITGLYRLVPWLMTDTLGNTVYGDYEGMAASAKPSPTPTFFPAWADNRVSGGTIVYAATYNP